MTFEKPFRVYGFRAVSLGGPTRLWERPGSWEGKAARCGQRGAAEVRGSSAVVRQSFQGGLEEAREW